MIGNKASRRWHARTTLLVAALCVVGQAHLSAAGEQDDPGTGVPAAEGAPRAPGAPAGTPAAGDDAALERRIAAIERQLAELRALIAAARGGGDVAELERRIEALSSEVERLRLGAAAPPEAAGSVGGFGPAASKVYRARRGVSIGGYGEFLYVDPSGRRDDGLPSGTEASADLLRAVLYFGYKFDDRFVFNSEIELEHALSGDDLPGEVAAEFAYVDFRWRPALGARGGLLLVPLGFLNELHEPPVFLGAQRPEVERFIIPSTWRELGAGLYGDAGPVAWKAYVLTSPKADGFSAGQGFRGGRQDGAKAEAEDLAFAARIDWVPIPGLLLGGAIFTGDTAQGEPGLDGARLTQYEVHAEWKARGVQTRALYASTRLDGAAEVSALVGETVGSRMRGYYAEAGYNVLATRGGTAQELVPFFRYESLDTRREVAPGLVADPANNRTVRTLGLHYRPIPGVAIKLDWQDLGNAAGTAVDRLNIALGWLF